ncbi:hypothetical protein VTO42DRAFT_1483 [Malbranchea cinnamomea]
MDGGFYQNIETSRMINHFKRYYDSGNRPRNAPLDIFASVRVRRSFPQFDRRGKSNGPNLPMSATSSIPLYDGNTLQLSQIST